MRDYKNVYPEPPPTHEIMAAAQIACLRTENERLRAERDELLAALRRIAAGGEIYDSAAHLMGIASAALAKVARAAIARAEGRA